MTISRRSFIFASIILPATTTRALSSPSLIKSPVKISNNIANISQYGGTETLFNLASEAVSSGRTLLIDRPVDFNRIWRPPNGLILLGSGDLDNSILQWTGKGDAIEATGSISVDRITIRGTTNGEIYPDKWEANCLFGVHGPMSERPKPISGVDIGELRVQHTRGLGVIIANVKNVRIDSIKVNNCFNHGLLLSGLVDGKIGSIVVSNVGNLEPVGQRQGVGVAIFSEGKPVSTWYDYKKIIKTETLTIESIKALNTTDSAIYIHDDNNTGVENVYINNIFVDTAGKDGCKTRSGPRNVHFGRVHTTCTSLRGLNIESDYTTVGTALIEHSGFDSVGAIYGRKMAYNGGDGADVSLQTRPGGISIANCNNIKVEKADIRHVRSNPFDLSEGHGLRLINVTKLEILVGIEDCDGDAVRISGCRESILDVDLSAYKNSSDETSAIRLSKDGFKSSSNVEINLSISSYFGKNFDGIFRSDKVCEKVILRINKKLLDASANISNFNLCSASKFGR